MAFCAATKPNTGGSKCQRYPLTQRSPTRSGSACASGSRRQRRPGSRSPGHGECRSTGSPGASASDSPGGSFPSPHSSPGRRCTGSSGLGNWGHLADTAHDPPRRLGPLDRGCQQSPSSVPCWNRIRVPRPRLGRLRTRPRRAMADRACDSRRNRAYLSRHGIQAVIPEKKDQRRNGQAKGPAGGMPPTSDREAHEDRNTVERYFNRLNRFGLTRPDTTISPSGKRPPSRSR